MNSTSSKKIPDDVAKRIIEILTEVSKPIRLIAKDTVYKIEFANGQRIIINFNIESGILWLAGKSVAAEFEFNNRQWLSKQDGSEFFITLKQLVQDILMGNALNNVSGKLTVIEQEEYIQQNVGNYERLEKKKFSWIQAAILVVVIVFGYKYISTTERAKNQDIASIETVKIQSVNNNAEIKCDAAIPVNGASETFESMTGNPSSRAQISLSNGHSHDLIVYFTKPNSAIPLHAVYVRARNQAQTSLDSGEYELMFSIGSAWCNFKDGFKNGDHSKLSANFSFNPKQESIFSMQSTGVKPEEFRVFMRTKDDTPAIPQQIISGGDMELHRAKDGHYYIQGSINGNPINFLVDTGASLTTIKQNLAITGGIKDCKAAQSNTANGIVDVCVGTIAEVRIGAYIINNAVIVSNPKTEVNLLGMNVLGQFKIRTENGVMYLSK